MEFTPAELGELARSVLQTCGAGAMLVCGNEAEALLGRLLAQGVDARGVESAPRRRGPLAAGRVVGGVLERLPFQDASFETLVLCDVLDVLDEGELAAALREAHRVTRRYLVATVTVGLHGEVPPQREAWERRCLQAGFRCHPLSQALTPYEGREQEWGHVPLLFERLSDSVCAAYPLERLESHRMLHMDMLRDSGRRADAHVARYHLALQLVRPGDVVLDVACGLGYGSAILDAGAPTHRVIGVDESEYAIEHARAAYGRPDGSIEFHCGDACALEFLPDASVDLVVSFETLEHVLEPERLLAELQRVLRPAGRVIVSVPNDWSDETGTDPNPHHHHVYDWQKLASQLGASFRLERAWAQTAGGASKLADSARELVEVSLDPPPARESEWWLACAMKDPVCADPAGYRETSFPDPGPPDDVHVAAFGRDYDDPWLVKGMVSIGMRSENAADRRAMASEVLENARPGSADVGAALCILAYDRLAQPEGEGLSRDELLAHIARYHDEADGTPHAWRWRISNQFVAAQLLRAAGRRDESFAAFVACADMDCLRFSPILATKTVDAGFQAGLMAAVDGERERARELWTAVVRTAQRALAGGWRSFLGDLERPIPFGLPEAAQVLDLTGRAVYALGALEHWGARPGWSFCHAHTSQERNRELLALAVDRHAADAASVFARLRAALADLAAAEARGEEKEGLLARLESEVRREQAEVAKGAAELAQTAAELAQTAAELARIHGSRGWRLLTRLYRIRDALLPRGSARRRLARRLTGGAPDDGPRSAKPATTLRSLIPAPLKPALRRGRTKARELRTRLRQRAIERVWERDHPALLPDGRRVVALQLETWDKGGVEEVVLSLALNLQRDPALRVVVFVTESGLGHLGRVARGGGIHVVSLNADRRFLRWLIARLGVQIVNLHYSVFGYQEYERAGVPMVYTVHNTYIWAGPDFAEERAEPYSKVSRFLAVSNAVKDYFERRFGIDPARVVAVPNGLDLDFVAAAESVERAELGIDDDDVVFLNVASFNVYKFHILMVAAMERVVRELPRAKLLLVGNTHEQRCLDYAQAEIERRGLSAHIQILGFAPKERVMGLMRLADVFLLPSLIEGWSIAVMEAMYSELPMILSDVGSARDVIQDEDIGIVVRNPYPDIGELTNQDVVQHYTDDRHLDNLDDLVAAMLRVGRDVEAWATRARLGRTKIETRYTGAHMARSYAACFADLLARKAGG